MDERQMQQAPAVLEFLLDEGRRAVDRAAAAVAVGHPASVAACAVACDLTDALRLAVASVGAEQALAVLESLATPVGLADRTSRGGTVRLAMAQAPALN